MSGENPFDYQRPLRAEAGLIDRRFELDALQRAAADRVTVRLASPRRYGKTSLLHAHLQLLRQAGHRACFVDFDRVGTVPDVADRLVKGLRGLPVDPERRLDRRLSRLGVSFGTTGLTMQMAPRRPGRALNADEARAVIRELLAIPGELAAQDNGLTVIAMDEFQDLLTADDRLDGVMRSVMQHQSDVTYVFAGSSPSMMRELFDNRERPFYGQARPLTLPPLPEDEAYAYVRDRLPEHPQREPSAAEIVQLADGHPQRTMLLAHHLFNYLDTHPNDSEPVGRVVNLALAELDDALISGWQSLNRGERAVVVALADGLSPTSRTVASEHGTARSSLQRAIERLEETGQHLDRRDGRLRLLDPLFAEWLRRR